MDFQYTLIRHLLIPTAYLSGICSCIQVAEAVQTYVVGGETDVIAGLKKAKEMLVGKGMIVLVTDARSLGRSNLAVPVCRVASSNV